MRERPLAYIETKRPPKSEAALATSIISHWQARHMHGKALVICDTPLELRKLTQKRWISAMQAMQHKRAQTIDADRLLSLTHIITRMQQMIITADSPSEFPAAHFWCLTSEQLTRTDLPRSCRTIYVCTPLSDGSKRDLYEMLPTNSLVINYTDDTNWTLQPKAQLEAKVEEAWHELTTFLEQCEIDTARLSKEQQNIDLLDDALDTLLDVSASFLRHARHFQEALHLAQPLTAEHTTKQQYELANLLARRVALLTPSLLHHSFVQADNETFSLYDATQQKITRESLSTAIARHIAAGRNNLAKALERAFVNNALAY